MPVSASSKGEMRWEHHTARKMAPRIRSTKVYSVVRRLIDQILATSPSSPSGRKYPRCSEGKKPSSCPVYPSGNNRQRSPVTEWGFFCTSVCKIRMFPKCFLFFSYRQLLSRFFHTRPRSLSSSVRKQYLPVSPAGFFLPVIKLPSCLWSNRHGCCGLAYTRARARRPFFPDAAFLRFLSCV